MVVLASLSGFFGTIFWTALVAVVCFTAGFYYSKKINKKLNEG